MSRKLIILGMLTLFLAPGAALSLGLGDIRLNSYLNQPMDAEISLTIGSPAELETLRVELAPSEAFARHGLVKPEAFNDLRFQLRSTGGNRAVVRVTSSRPVTEPFLTFLVEARWAGGRSLREYTVLLDPPTFLPAREAAQAPAQAVDAPRPAPVERAAAAPAEAPAPVAAVAPAQAAAQAAPAGPAAEYAEGGEYGPVRRNDTLWGIAQRVRADPGLSTNQVMLALYRANPGAFDGNINRLRAGAILRVPSRGEMADASAREATAEVRRQEEAWRAGVGAPAAERRLELAPPTESPRPVAASVEPAGDRGAGSPALLDAIEQLRGELSETRRLMEIKDAEIAALQARLSDLEAEGAALMPLPAQLEVPGAALMPLPAQLEAPVPATALVGAAEPAFPVGPVTDPAPAAQSPGAVTEPAPAALTPAATASPPAAPPGLLERVMSVLGSLWLWLLLAVALVAAAVVIILRKRRADERSIEDHLAETGTWGAMPVPATAAAAGGAGAPAAVQPRTVARDDRPAILVEEAAPRPAAPEPVAARGGGSGLEFRSEEDYQYPFEDTIAGETGINLDQTDPMAEADFHMAYGLYDQAAEIMRKAVQREPDRYDLRRKLIDICFVWGNAEEFLAQARAVQQMGGDAQAADWGKIGIMGRQICPGEPLFVAGGESTVSVDFGPDEMDFAATEAGSSASGAWLDFDVGESGDPIVSLDDTREQPGPSAARSIDHTAELDLEELGIDLDLGESGEYALKDMGEGLPGDDEDKAFTGTLRLDDAPGFGRPDTRLDAPEEGSGTLIMDAPHMAPGIDAGTQRGIGPGLAVNAADFSALTGINIALDETSLHESGVDDDPTMSGLGALPNDENGGDAAVIARHAAADDSPTGELPAFSDDLDLDLDLDDLTQSLEADLAAHGTDDDDLTQRAQRAVPAGSGDDDATMMAPAPDFTARRDNDATAMSPELDERYGAADQGDETREMPGAEINEIATKLDLARAYIDMGDAEGARSILGEVVDEGDEVQREEARHLLDTVG
jgi:pilus assembly protein FimV